MQPFPEMATTDRSPLYTIPLFMDVNRGIIDSILDTSHVCNLKDGDVLLSPHSPNQHLFVVLSGALQVHVGKPEQSPVATIARGDCVGEMSIIDSKPPSAYVIATQPTTVLSIHRDSIWKLIDATRGLARNLLYVLSNRLRLNNDALQESIRQQGVFEQFAHRDPLTNLHNRRWLDSTLERIVSGKSRADLPLTMALLDIDHFKRFNDKYGHLGGDQALRQIADIMRANLPPNDMTARFGGEEFAILLPGTELEAGREIAVRLRDATRATTLTSVEGEAMDSITVSLGVAELQPGYDANQLIACADVALYQAKKTGRDQVVVHTPADKDCTAPGTSPATTNFALKDNPSDQDGP